MLLHARGRLVALREEATPEDSLTMSEIEPAQFHYDSIPTKP